ncbi:MAG: hypothetical protein N2C14_27050, partial [Planctomycetales bacterium]
MEVKPFRGGRPPAGFTALGAGLNMAACYAEGSDVSTPRLRGCRARATKSADVVALRCRGSYLSWSKPSEVSSTLASRMSWRNASSE